MSCDVNVILYHVIPCQLPVVASEDSNITKLLDVLAGHDLRAHAADTSEESTYPLVNIQKTMENHHF